MKTAGRYKARGRQAEFEPGSGGRVLRNLLGIRSAREMARVESEALIAVQERLVDEISSNQRLTAAAIRRMHRSWLGDIYSWAGEYRVVNIAKGGFQFAAAAQVPRLMSVLQRQYLNRYTPCHAGNAEEVAMALAVVHAELVLIHPFREGNGRCARLVSLLMGLQAGLPPLDYGGLRGGMKRSYIAAIHAAVDGHYEPMRTIFSDVIRRTLRRHGRRGGS